MTTENTPAASDSPTATPTAEQLHATAARAAITTAIARLAQLADDGDPVEYAAIFTEDAVWELRPGGNVPIAPSRVEGRAAILAAVHQRRAEGVQGPGSHTAHSVSTTSIAVEAHRAVAKSLLTFYVGLDATPQLRAITRYTDTFAQQPGGEWLLAHRIITSG